MTFDSFQTQLQCSLTPAFSALSETAEAQGKSSAKRRLRYALAASLLVHLLLLSPGSLLMVTEDTPSVLQATLRKLPQPLQAEPPPAAQLPAPRPAPRAVPPAPTSTQQAAKPATPALDQAKPVSVPAKNVQPEEPAAKTSSVPVAIAAPSAPPAASTPSAASIPSAPSNPDAGSLLTEANAVGEAIDGLRGYRLAVATQARRFKRYPAQALASGWTGTVEIRFRVGADGRPQAATVVRSSGHEALDRAALTMIDAGALRARLPESLRGKAFVVALPVVFNLEDE
jgi:protein TonB